jgi:hypothetical protein
MWFYGTSKVTEQGRETPFVVPNSVYASDGKANITPVTAQDYWPAISSITESNIEDGTYLNYVLQVLPIPLSTGTKNCLSDP